MKTLIHILLFISLFQIRTANSQVITSLPPNESNARFFSEVFTEVKRPALSITGFDNGGNHSKGYGLKQILNNAYVSGTNEQKVIFKDIIDYSQNNQINLNPSTRQHYQDNTNILQYRAFEALASYVLEKNGVTASISNNTWGIPIRTHSVALAAFKSDILALAGEGKLATPFLQFTNNEVHS